VTDPDRRAWHLALASTGPDEELAAELERSADRAQARGGLAAAAALLERSMALTPDPARRARRTLAAASAHLEAGSFEAATTLLAAADTGPIDESGQARIEVMRGYAANSLGDNSHAAALLFRAAKRLETIDVRLARDMYIGALSTAASLGDTDSGASHQEIPRAARAAPPAPLPPRPQDLLLDGLAILATDGRAAATPALRRAIAAFMDVEALDSEGLRYYGYPVGPATLLWEYAGMDVLAAHQVQAARALGALRMLPFALDIQAMVTIIGGDFSSAELLVGEAASVIEATGSRVTLCGGAQLAGWRGRPSDAEAQIDATIERARGQAEGMAMKFAQSARTTLNNALGHYEQALAAAQEALTPPLHRGSHLALHELVEAAARSGQRAVATEALDQLLEATEASGTDWALGIVARCRALLSAGNVAEALYLEAIVRLDRSPIRPEAARAHLLYGEWLRREKRRLDARHHLRTAYEQLTTIGMDAFAARAAKELAATGETVRTRSVESRHDLTPQELQIARLVVEHRTNAEIGAQLFLSTRTVEWHLRKVFMKFDVSSRKELRESLLRAG
jgi:DNA-binding CsgD family transcriptional regulator